MKNNIPKGMLGLHHLALDVYKLEACVDFYTRLLGFSIEWQPDPDNVYLTSGTDNLALHRSKNSEWPKEQRLNHLGCVLNSPEAVDEWYHFLLHADVEIKTEPKLHRDGSKGFYCLDPEGNGIEIIYHPPISIKAPV